MNKLNFLYWKELFKGYLKILTPIVLLLSFFLAIFIMKLPSGEPVDRLCDVVATGANFGATGNHPYIICSFESGETVNVYTTKASNVKNGTRIKVKEQSPLLWYSKSYSYVEE
jgi:hypothetical protein